MDLMRLAYASVSLVDAFSSEMLDIARSSTRRNARLGVTGALLFDGWSFFSVLEGERSALAILVDRIGRDSRHAGMITVEHEETDGRLFRQWHLRRIDRAETAALPSPTQILAMSPRERRALALVAVRSAGDAAP